MNKETLKAIKETRRIQEFELGLRIAEGLFKNRFPKHFKNAYLYMALKCFGVTSAEKYLLAEPLKSTKTFFRVALGHCLWDGRNTRRKL